MGEKNRRNYYRVLHVQPDAPVEVIKASYRTLMRTLRNHPDLGGDGANAALINEAYAVLSDAGKRERYDAAQSASPGPADSRTCAFCQADNTNSSEDAEALCSGCGAPLMLVESDSGNVSVRKTGRIEYLADISYLDDPWRRDSTTGKVMDLSPTGLRFLSRKRLTRGCVIKIDTPTLCAVARVTRSEPDAETGAFSTGVRFLTLKLGRPRGTFVSERA